MDYDADTLYPGIQDDSWDYDHEPELEIGDEMDDFEEPFSAPVFDQPPTLILGPATIRVEALRPSTLREISLREARGAFPSYTPQDDLEIMELAGAPSNELDADSSATTIRAWLDGRRKAQGAMYGSLEVALQSITSMLDARIESGIVTGVGLGKILRDRVRY